MITATSTNIIIKDVSKEDVNISDSQLLDQGELAEMVIIITSPMVK